VADLLPLAFKKKSVVKTHQVPNFERPRGGPRADELLGVREPDAFDGGRVAGQALK
jgi:hypothetical protein